ncbi:MAG: alpha/beta hydrolase [Woeseiaceae bacterium]
MVDESNYVPAVARETVRHTIRGVDYLVSQWGSPDAPLIVYLHGWGDTGSTFQFVVDELRRDWFVVAPDWRGFGGSTCDVASYWFPDYLADLDHLLALYSPSRAIRLVGHSMGANVAGLYAGVMPDRVCAFVNIEGFGLVDAEPDDAPGRFRHWIEQGRSPAAFSQYADYEALAERVIRRAPRMTSSRADFVAREWGEVAQDSIQLRADARHRLPNPVLYRRAEAEACWRSATAAVLLVAGSDSDFAKAVDPGLARGGLQLPFPNARAVVIDNAGHMLHFEAPRDLACAIEDFFATTL